MFNLYRKNPVHLKISTGGDVYFYIFLKNPEFASNKDFLKKISQRYPVIKDFSKEDKFITLNVGFLNNTKKSENIRLTTFSKNGTFRIIRNDFYCEFDFRKNVADVSLIPDIYSFDSLLRIVSSFVAVLNNSFYLHSSGVVYKNKAYLFTGKTGSGKTTIARKFPRSQVLSDEIVFVRKSPRGDVFAHSTPFWGELKSDKKEISAELKNIYFIHKAKEFILKKINPSESVKKLLPNILFFAKDNNLINELFETVFFVSKNVSFYDLFLPENFDIERWLKNADKT